MTKRIVNIEVIDPGSAPDVDSDFSTMSRDHAIEYVKDKYGNVANIITFNTLAAKKAFKAMCTIYEIPFAQANKVASLIPPPIEGVDCKLSEIFDPNSSRFSEGVDFRNATAGEEWTKLIKGAIAIEGRNDSTGVHPCGIIISQKPLEGIVPTHVRQSDGTVISQWTYGQLEEIGLIKMDFLGLDTVDLIQHTVENIKDSDKEVPNMTKIIHGPMDDKNTFDMISRGDTTGVFQLAGDGVKDLLRRMKPSVIDDIVATTALYRPGPMGMQSHIKYADRKNGREAYEYPVHPDFKGTVLEKILESTQGLIVYQESIMQIASEVGGMTLQQGDDLRKAMGKKIMSKMQAMKPTFIEGGLKNGYSSNALEMLWETMAVFAQYGFNKCLHGRTRVATNNGKFTIEELYKELQEDPMKNIEILSMFEDGSFKLHKINDIVKSGRKPVFTIQTEGGKKIKVTEDHRMLTTDGYKTIADGGLIVGSELIHDEEWNTRLSPKTIKTRANNMSNVNRTPKMRESARARLTEYQAILTYEDRVAHQQKIQKENPERTKPWIEAGQNKVKELRQDPVWRNKWLDAMEKERQKRIKSGNYKGMGRLTQISDGRWCDSFGEALAAEYLLSRGVKFELHKRIEGENFTRISDFYVNGIYFEFDGLGRGRKHFEEKKYGKDIPFVYMTPLDYKDVIDEALMTHHGLNGDKIVAIIKPKRSIQGGYYAEMTYDIEMEDNGPANFLANGLVSHNSHSVAYGINAYQAAYLKANYPIEFMAALINQRVDNKEKTLAHLQEARRMGLKVGPIDANKSRVRVSPAYTGDFDIVFGFGGVKSLSIDNAELIVQEREKNGEFKSPQDFVQRCYSAGITNKRIFENLVYAGAFDTMGFARKAVVDTLPQLINNAKTKSTRGASLFDMFGSSSESSSMAIEFSKEEYSKVEGLKLEADAIGLYLSGHPLDNVGKGLNWGGVTSLKDLHKSTSGTQRLIVGAITDVEVKIARRGGKSMIITIDDGTDYLTARLDRKIVKAIDKKTSQEKIEALYRKGEVNLSLDLLQSATNPEVDLPLADIVKNDVYLMNVTYRPARGEQSYGARIDSIVPLRLTHEGELPIRVRAQTGSKFTRISKALENKFPGSTPVWVVETDLDKLGISVPNDGLYEAASRVMNNNDQNVIETSTKELNNVKRVKSLDGSSKNVIQKKKLSKKTESSDIRIWPPTGVKTTTFIPVTQGDRISAARAIELLHYVDTGNRTQYTRNLEKMEAIPYEIIDFGIAPMDKVEMALEN